MLVNEVKDRFTQIPNEVITDIRLTDKALRVFLYLASKPTGWNIFNADVQKSLGIKQKSTIANIWKQLDELGYISRIKVTQNSELAKNHKTGSYIYTLYAYPSQSMIEPKVGKSQSMVEPKDGMNQTHSNKELISNKELNNKEIVVSELTDATYVAEYLYNRLLTIQPNLKSNYTTWIKDIDLAIRIDGRTKEHLIRCIDWMYTDKKNGSFWIPNIMSGRKLREKYDQLFMQMNIKPQQQQTQYKSKQQTNKENIQKFARMYGDLPVENNNIENVEVIGE